MARQSIDIIADFSDRNVKRSVQASIGAMSGLYEVSIRPKRETRSNQANAYYWAVVVRAFTDFMREQDYDLAHEDECHGYLKARFLAVTIRGKKTGKVLGRRVRSTKELTTAEFYDYVERCRAWLADAMGVVTPDPDKDFRQDRKLART